MSDQRCPACEGFMGVYRLWAGGAYDYAVNFEYTCEHCGTKLAVEVESIPVFGFTVIDSKDLSKFRRPDV